MDRWNPDMYYQQNSPRKKRIVSCTSLPAQRKLTRNLRNPLTNDPYYSLILPYLSTFEVITKLSLLSQWNYHYLTSGLNESKQVSVIIDAMIKNEFNFYLNVLNHANLHLFKIMSCHSRLQTLEARISKIRLDYKNNNYHKISKCYKRLSYGDDVRIKNIEHAMYIKLKQMSEIKCGIPGLIVPFYYIVKENYLVKRRQSWDEQVYKYQQNYFHLRFFMPIKQILATSVANTLKELAEWYYYSSDNEEEQVNQTETEQKQQANVNRNNNSNSSKNYIERSIQPLDSLDTSDTLDSKDNEKQNVQEKEKEKESWNVMNNNKDNSDESSDAYVIHFVANCKQPSKKQNYFQQCSKMENETNYGLIETRFASESNLIKSLIFAKGMILYHIRYVYENIDKDGTFRGFNKKYKHLYHPWNVILSLMNVLFDCQASKETFLVLCDKNVINQILVPIIKSAFDGLINVQLQRLAKTQEKQSKEQNSQRGSNHNNSNSNNHNSSKHYYYDKSKNSSKMNYKHKNLKSLGQKLCRLMMTPLLMIVKQILKANQSVKYVLKVYGDEYGVNDGLIMQFEELANVYKENLRLVCERDPNMTVNIVKFVQTKHQIKKWAKEKFNHSWKPFLPENVNRQLLE